MIAILSFPVPFLLSDWTTQRSNLQNLNEVLNVIPDEELSTGSGGRLGATIFFPDFSFRSPVMYRIRNVDGQGRFLVGSKLMTGTDWQELDSNTFRRVQLRPVRSTGLSNLSLIHI